MYRSYIAQRQYAVVLQEVNNSSPAEIQAVRLLAEFLQSPAKRYVLNVITAWLTGSGLQY